MTPSPDETALFIKVARDLATEQSTPEGVCERYSMSMEYLDEIQKNPFYCKVYATYRTEWESLGSTHKRVAFAAAIALEEKLPVLADRMGSRSSELADAVAAAKLFRELAGIAAPAPGHGGGGGERFQINISIGKSTVQLETKTVEPVAIEHKGDGST
jgi:hypothetical protein